MKAPIYLILGFSILAFSAPAFAGSSDLLTKNFWEKSAPACAEAMAGLDLNLAISPALAPTEWFLHNRFFGDPLSEHMGIVTAFKDVYKDSVNQALQACEGPQLGAQVNSSNPSGSKVLQDNVQSAEVASPAHKSASTQP
jgi:hypothetical protein